MANMTLSIPDGLHKEMKKFPWMRWSEVARQAIQERVKTISEVERIAKKSKLTEKDAKIIAEKINRAATERALNEAGIRH
tara:strand:+ start:737 stop:976 length:240 start_codon:yes stop_codon:yes gene_type:complete